VEDALAHKKEDLLQLDTRRAIYDYVKRCPGAHLRGVEREVGLPFGQVLYHLDYLERNGLVVAKKDGGFKRYFVTNHIGRKEKQFLSMFRHDLPRKVAILLLLNPGQSHRELLECLSISGSTLSFHLNKMVDSGLLVRREEGNENFYHLEDEKTAAKTLILYRESFEDAAVDRFAEVWLTANFLQPEERREALMGDLGGAFKQRAPGTFTDLASSVLDG